MPATPARASAAVVAAAMGRGRSRKLHNSATFRLCPRPGAADASDRVFVRVDANPYSVPGFADDDRDYYAGVVPSSSADAAAGGPLPEHVRREILGLGLPDDGYDYLPHLREIRPSLSSTGGGGSSAAFLPARRPGRFGLPLNVKAYDARGVEVGSAEAGAAASVTVMSRVEEAVDLDVAELLEESDAPTGALEDEDLEEDFVIIANQPEEEEQMDVEEDFVILASQREEEDQVDVEEEEERLEDAGSDEVPLTDDQIEMIKLLHQLL